MQRFEGHRGTIQATDWRVVDGLVFQLVSLDDQGHLRLWRVEVGLVRSVPSLVWDNGEVKYVHIFVND